AAKSTAPSEAPDTARSAQGDADERERVWWGRTLAPDARAALAARVRAAMADADAIGVPAIARLLRDDRLARRAAVAAQISRRPRVAGPRDGDGGAGRRDSRRPSLGLRRRSGWLENNHA